MRSLLPGDGLGLTSLDHRDHPVYLDHIDCVDHLDPHNCFDHLYHVECFNFLIIFIGPESDHWECLSLTDSLTP